MFPDRSLVACTVSAARVHGLPLVVLGLGALAGGCSSFGLGHHPAAAPSSRTDAADTSVAGPALEESETATEEATPMTGARSEVDSNANSVIKSTAPKRYTVKRGDTLWAIANLFLRDPWLWPEIWHVNPQIANPHLIYPGDVLALALGADGKPEIRIVQEGEARLNPRLRVSAADAPIATIPYDAIAAFLLHPSVLSKEQFRDAPHVVAFRDSHDGGGTGDEIYVSNLNAPKDARFSVVHVDERLKDPETGAFLGYLGIYTASALVIRAGNPATAVLTDSARETLEGDKLVAIDTNVPLNFEPRAPRRSVHGEIIAVADGGDAVIGQYRVVVINRGARDGLEAGSVLAVSSHGEVVRDYHAAHFSLTHPDDLLGPRVRLPDERNGTMLVFKTYDRISYALIVVADNMIHVADRIANP